MHVSHEAGLTVFIQLNIKRVFPLPEILVQVGLVS